MSWMQDQTQEEPRTRQLLILLVLTFTLLTALLSVSLH